MVFQVVTPCSLVHRCLCFGGIHCVHLQGKLPLYPQYRGSTFLQNVGTHLPKKRRHIPKDHLLNSVQFSPANIICLKSTWILYSVYIQVSFFTRGPPNIFLRMSVFINLLPELQAWILQDKQTLQKWGEVLYVYKQVTAHWGVNNASNGCESEVHKTEM
jgi:hypothetical protein